MTFEEALLETIKSRRTIRKYLRDRIPSREIVQRITSIPFYILEDFPIPFLMIVLEDRARDRGVEIITKTYEVARDLALQGNIIPPELRDWYIDYIKQFVRTLGNAPIVLVGLTDLASENRYRNFAVSWMIAQAIMVHARAEGLDTGSFTFTSKSVQTEFVRDFLKMDEKLWQIAFTLNLGYRDEEPLPKEIREDVFVEIT